MEQKFDIEKTASSQSSSLGSNSNGYAQVFKSFEQHVPMKTWTELDNTDSSFSSVDKNEADCDGMEASSSKSSESHKKSKSSGDKKLGIEKPKPTGFIDYPLVAQVDSDRIEDYDQFLAQINAELEAYDDDQLAQQKQSLEDVMAHITAAQNGEILA